MRKLLLAALAILAFAPAARAADKVTLTLFMYRDVTAPEAGTWDLVLDGFKKANPGIEIQAEYLFNDPYHQKLRAMAQADQLPDVFFLWPDKKTGFVNGLEGGKSFAKDLRPFLKGHEAEFVPSALTPQGRGGELFELPEQVTATHVFYVNNALLKKLGLTFPKTVAELIAQGKKIRDAGLVPIAMANKDGWEMQSCLLSALTERAGGLDWYNKVIKGEGASFADPQFVNALDVIKQLSDNQMFAPGINQMDYGVASQMFAAEKAVYYIDGGWKVNELLQTLTPEQKQNITLETIPEIPNQKGKAGSTALVAGTGLAMNTKLSGAKADAAWKFVYWYAGHGGAEIRMENGALPAYKVDVTKLSKPVDPLVQKLQAFLASHAAGYVIDSKMDGEGMKVLHPALQEMMFGKKTPKQVGEEYEAWVKANDTNRKKKT
jgi:raffinose/stachyose/melibiose transport system substrate-binding protein